MRQVSRITFRTFGSTVFLAIALGCTGDGRQAPPPDLPHDSIETILTHADSAYREGDYIEAQNTYEQALLTDPAIGGVVPKLGICYLKNRRIRKAEDLLLTHLGEHPDDASAHLVLARVYLNQARLDDAANALEVVLRTHPDNLLARYNLGFISYRGGRYDEAETHLRRTIELRPGHPEAHYTLGLTLLAQRRMEESVASLERAVAIDAGHVGARFNLARAYAMAGRLEEAEEQSRIYADVTGRSQAAVEKDQQIRSQMLPAVQYRLDGKFPEALVEYRAMAERYPDHAPLYTEIARLQLRLGQHDEALKTLLKAVSLDPQLSEPHYLLAGLYRGRGDHAAADREMGTFTTLESIAEGKGRY